MFIEENAVKTAVGIVGGPTKAAHLCGVSNACVHKWIAAERIPNIDHARAVAKASKMGLEKLRPV
jgi:DNA-binding transcriptional regulator YdaS (Cro superfamily)